MKERKHTETTVAALSELGAQLSATQTVRGAAEIITEIADRLFGCDVCKLDLYYPEADQFRRVLTRGVVNGRQTDIPPAAELLEPAALTREVFEQGAKLIMEPPQLPMGALPCGTPACSPGSLMAVPIRHGAHVCGVLTLQSHTAHAYNQDRLQNLQMLADYCGGALERIRAQEALREAKEELSRVNADLERKVTERTLALAEANIWLRQSEERLKLALTASRTGVWEWNVQTNAVFWSEECSEITGAKNFRGTLESLANAILSEDAPRVKAAMEKALTDRTDYAVEFRVAQPNGEVRWMSHFGRAEFDSTGSPVRVVGTVCDITRRKEAEARIIELNENLVQRASDLESERARWQRLVESIADEVWLCDRQGRLTLANRPQASGVAQDLVEAKLIPELMEEIEVFEPDGRLRPFERAPLLLSLRGEIVHGEEIIRHRVTGRTRWRQFSSAPVRDPAGTILGAIAIARDVTEQKRTEELLRLTQFSVEKSSEAILWLGLDGRLSYVNEAACRLLAYSREKLMEMDIHDIDPGQPRDSWAAACERLEQVKVFTFETNLLRKDKSLVPAEVTVNYLQYGEKTYHCAFLRDITLRKRAEATLLQDLERRRLLLEFHDKALNLTALEFYDYVLEQVVRSTGSQVGFLHYVSTDGRIILLTIWSQAVFSRYDVLLGTCSPVETAARWRDCIRLGQAVICNEVTAEADLKGFPTGHISVQRLMSIPVIEADEVSLIFSTGNKEDEYSEGDVVQIRLLTNELRKIRKQRRVEEKVRRSEERFRVLFESLTDALYVHRIGANAAESRFIEVNDVACRLLGFTREELLTKSPYDIDAPDSGVSMASVSKQLAFGKAVLFEQVHVTKDKRRIPVEISTRLFVLDGRLAVVSLARDITQRNIAEETLRKLSRAVEQSSAGIVITDLMGNIEYVNPRYCVVTGYTLEEVIGQNPRILKSGHTSQEEYQRLWQTILSDRDWNGELLNRKKSGELFWERATISPIKQPGGKITHFVAVKEDVTQQKRTEKALLDSECLLRQQYAELEMFYRTMPVGVCLIDADLRFVRMNEQLAAINGKSVEAHLGRRIHEVIPDLAPILEPIYRRVFATGESALNVEVHGITDAQPGQVRDWLANYHPLKADDGTVRGLCAVVVDITARKRSEAALRASREELRALAGRLQFVREEERTHIAREIHDVLAQELTCLRMEIVSLKTRLVQRRDALTDEFLLLRLEEMDAAANRSIESVQKIASELRPVVLDTLGLCAAIEWQLKDFEVRTGISSEASVPEECPSLDRDRSTALFRILQESLTNVLRHAAATKVQVCLERHPDQVVLTVRDNGRGMEAAKLNDPHSIGLVGMRERALLLGGQFQISSQPGAGTTVEVRVGLSAAQE